MNFVYPWALLLYLPLALTGWLVWRRRLPAARVSTVKPFAAAAGKRRPFARLPLLLYLAAAALLVFAMARPRRGIEHTKIRAEGIDIVVAFDLSGSMELYDVPANIRTEGELRRAFREGKIRNRHEIAKEEFKKFIARRPNDRIGLVVFSPLPFVVSPPTLDHAWLLDHLEHVEPGTLGAGTCLASPVASAINRLRDSESKRRVVVLLTDGANNVEAKITPLQAAALAKTYNVILYTVGIGGSQSFIIQQTPFGERLNFLRDEYDEPLMREMAKIGGGRFYGAEDAEGLERALAEIDELETTTAEQYRFMEYREWAPMLAWICLLVLLLGFALEHTLLLRAP